MCFLVPFLTGLNITYHCCFSLSFAALLGVINKKGLP
jgi:hypothetical protein